MSSNNKNTLKMVIVITILVLAAIITLFPFIWMILTSLKTLAEATAVPPVIFPAEWQFSNYPEAMTYAPFGIYFVNSVIVATISTIFVLMVTALAGFGLTKYDFRGKEWLITLMLATMMVPGEMLIITNFQTVSTLHLVDTRIAIFLPYIASVFYIILATKFYQQVPKELYLAAKVDGDSDFKYFKNILLPISKPIMITIGLLNVIGSWNAFLWPLLITNSVEKRTLPIGLSYFTSEAGSEVHLLMAASTIIILPLIILFIFTRKYIISGLTSGAVKG